MTATVETAETKTAAPGKPTARQYIDSAKCGSCGGHADFESGRTVMYHGYGCRFRSIADRIRQAA